MTDWEPLDEKELLREDDEGKVYHDNNSPQEPQAPGGGVLPSPEPSSTSLPRSGGREITREMILRSIEKQGSKRRPSPNPDEPHAEDRFLAAQSHLHLNGLHIGRIANLRPMTTLEVLYLYDNQISVIEGLSHLRRLTHLYLSKNAISAISGLAGLTHLQKLYLDHNAITVISGLEACPSLEELHVSSQRLPPGTALSFDPASVAALGASLRVLTASACGVTAASLAGLAAGGGLRRLKRLDLSHNAIKVEEGGFEALDAAAGGSEAPLLSNVDLRGNPLCRAPKYRDTLILMNDSLATIDDEAVSPQHREFLLRLHIRRMKAQLAAELKDDPAAAAASTSSSGGGGGAAAVGQAAAAAAGHPGHGYTGHGGGLVGGTMGQGSRVPPRTGGFAGGGGRGGGGRGGGGGGGAAGLTLGMDGLAISR